MNNSICWVDRSIRKRHKPLCLWFTGLSGAGKTTIGRYLEAELLDRGYHTMMLDGDEIRTGLNEDLRFSPEDRTENIRRIAHVAKLMVDAGLVVICTTISPFEKDRVAARRLFSEREQFVEVFVDTPLLECQARDPKGLYGLIEQGTLDNFPGVHFEYEVPPLPNIHVRTSHCSPQQAVGKILTSLRRSNLIGDFR